MSATKLAAFAVSPIANSRLLTNKRCISLSKRIAPHLPRRRLTKQIPTCAQQQTPPQQPVEGTTYPGFLRDADDASVQPRTSFFDTPLTTPMSTTPNDRVMQQVRQTMQQLGVSDDHVTNAREPPVKKPKTIQEMAGINPLSPLAGAAGAALMSTAAWQMLLATVNFAVMHPMDDRIYIVQRVAVVIRTTLVCLFALGSGISGLTSVGLVLVGLRLAYAHLSGELRNADKNQ